MNAIFDVSGVVLETPRLILREWKTSDLNDLFTYASVPDVGLNAGWQPHKTLDDSKYVLDMFINQKKTFAIERKERGIVIGSIGIENLVSETMKNSNLIGREIGYALSKSFWGQGIMTEGVTKVIDYCFTELNYDFLTCGHFLKNERSKRVIEKCGFEFFENGNFTTNSGEIKQSKYYVLYNRK